RNKFGMTVLGDYEYVTSCLNLFQHSGGLSENVTSRHLNLIQNHDALFSVQRVLASGKRLFSANGEPLNG
ncbi:hypothetical protein, partial [Mesotoga sp. HF07.pep.5.2.highcov]|uniref:hypothetical protein n=1 Tax=Mesotoga sp. HF07.pep.5.2.highcov TaxID=1462923 RepID=UPI001C7CA575